MKAQLGRHSDTLYAVVRIVVGFLFACHGVQKLMMIMAGTETPMPATMLWAAMLIELVGGALVMVGMFTSWAAFISSGTMAAAYFIAHQKEGLLPVQNNGELAAVYAFVFLYIAARGSGRVAAVQPD
jgi:putative oxidoreductase